MKILCTVALMLSSLASCAWVPSKEASPENRLDLQAHGSEEAQGASPVEVPISKLDQAIGELEIRWANEKSARIGANQIARRSESSWVSNVAVSLPVLPPEEIQTSIGLGISVRDLAGLRIRVMSTSGESIEQRELRMRDISLGPWGDGSQIRFVLRDIDTILSDAREQRAFLTVFISSETITERSLSFILTTPPSKISRIEEKSVFPGDQDVIQGLPARLSSQARSRFLLRSLKLRNDTFLPVRISVPFRTDLQIQANQQYHWSEVEPQSNPYFNRYVQRVRSSEHTGPASLFVYQAIEGLAESWTGVGQPDLEGLLVPPGGTILFGLYADEDAVDFLNRFPNSAPMRRMASVSAQAFCAQENRNWSVEIRDDRCNLMLKAGYRFSNEAVEVCKSSILQLQACKKGQQSACDEMASIDIRLDRELRAPHPDNGVAWPIFLGCNSFERNAQGRVSRIRYAWQWRPIEQEFLEGLETLGTEFVSDSGGIKVHARFETSNPSADQEFREILFWNFPLDARPGSVVSGVSN
jgi:hypothetical protein